LIISNHNCSECCSIKLLPCILFEKHINILALEMASPRNQHCVSCIGTLSFPIHPERRRSLSYMYRTVGGVYVCWLESHGHRKAKTTKATADDFSTRRSANAKGLYTARKLNWIDLIWSELTCSKSTQLRDAFIGHARQRHDLTSYSETRTVCVRFVLNRCIPVWRFIPEFGSVDVW